MTTITVEGITYAIDQSIDLSRAVSPAGVSAWYTGSAEFVPFEWDHKPLSVAHGAAVNVERICFYPHAHGTHTETLGHISETPLPISSLSLPFLITAKLIIPKLERRGADLVLSAQGLLACDFEGVKALIIKLHAGNEYPSNYDHSNWPYLLAETAELLAKKGIEHLVLDTPSIDKEKDGGAVAAHKAYWQLETADQRNNATITELAAIPDYLTPGSYLLQLQVAPIESDAAPSRPLIFLPCLQAR